MMALLAKCFVHCLSLLLMTGICLKLGDLNCPLSAPTVNSGVVGVG